MLKILILILLLFTWLSKKSKQQEQFDLDNTADNLLEFFIASINNRPNRPVIQCKAEKILVREKIHSEFGSEGGGVNIQVKVNLAVQGSSNGCPEFYSNLGDCFVAALLPMASQYPRVIRAPVERFPLGMTLYHNCSRLFK